MSNLEAAPAELECRGGEPAREAEVLDARDVPLGGPRAMRVRRTLPQRKRSLIGAWCFADHYGPDSVSTGARMDVGPHPHTGLQTVSWLFAGEVEHRDSLGTHADRRLVLRRPLRTRRRRPQRRHERRATPPYRPADGELAVQGRDRAP